MKKGYLACLAILLLFFAVPLFAQGIDVTDEEMIVMSTSPNPDDDPPAAMGAGQGQPPAAGPERHWDMHHPGEMHHEFKAGFGHYLKLSQEQKTKMRELWLRHFAETHNLRYDLMQKRLEMARLFTDPKTDSATLLAKHKELSAVQQQLMDKRAQAVIEWRGLLTPEQIQKLDLMIMAHYGMGRPMGHMGHEMGGGCGMGQGMRGHEMHKGMMHHEMGSGMPGHEMHQGMMGREMGSGPGSEMGQGEMGTGAPESAPMSSGATGSDTTDSAK